MKAGFDADGARLDELGDGRAKLTSCRELVTGATAESLSRIGATKQPENLGPFGGLLELHAVDERPMAECPATP